METPARDALRDRLEPFQRLVEVGIGRRTDVAAALAAAGHDVLAIDVVDCDVPPGVAFRRADATAVDPADLAPRDAVYALNLPPELHRPVADLATALDAPLVFTTLGFDEPALHVARESVAGDVLYVHPPAATDDVGGDRDDPGSEDDRGADDNDDRGANDDDDRGTEDNDDRGADDDDDRGADDNDDRGADDD